MSDLCKFEFEDIVWDDFCQSDDHIVPHCSREQANKIPPGDDMHKRPRLEVSDISNNSGNRSATRNIAQEKEHGDISNLSKNMKLEKDSWPNGVITSSSDSDSIKEVSSLASQNTKTSSHGFKSNNTDSIDSEFCVNDPILKDQSTAVDGDTYSYPLGDISQTENDLCFFDRNPEDKDSSDFLYYGWPEIGNFDDVDWMFRSCDSTFGLGPCKEDELGWLSSPDTIGGPGDLPKSDFKVTGSQSNTLENISENHDSMPKASSSRNDPASKGGAIRYKDSSWPPENDESVNYPSFAKGPSSSDSKDKFMPKGQGVGLTGKVQPKISTKNHSKTGTGGMINEHKKLSKHQNQSGSGGKRKGQYYGNGTFNYMSNMPNEVIQLHSGATGYQGFASVGGIQHQEVLGPDSFCYLQSTVSYVHSDNSLLSDQTSVHPALSAVKSVNNDVTSLSPRKSSYASSQVISTESFQDPFFQVAAISVNEKIDNKLHNHQGSQSLNSNISNAAVMVPASINDPVPVEKQAHLSGDIFENHSVVGLGMVIPVELGLSNVKEGSSMSPVLDDISLDTASFRQLQLVMEHV